MFCNIFCFEYQGVSYALDPIKRYDKWVYNFVCADHCERRVFNGLNDLMSAQLFSGRSLNEIADKITIIEL